MFSWWCPLSSMNKLVRTSHQLWQRMSHKTTMPVFIVPSGRAHVTSENLEQGSMIGVDECLTRSISPEYKPLRLRLQIICF